MKLSEGYGKTVDDFFTYLLKKDIFNEPNVIMIQYLMRRIQRLQLELKCIEYAKNEKENLCYFEETKPAEDGKTHVKLHVNDNIEQFTNMDSLLATVAAIANCERSSIEIVGLRPASSFIIVISMKEDSAKRLRQKSPHELVALMMYKVDWIEIENEPIYIPRIKEKKGEIEFEPTEKPEITHPRFSELEQQVDITKHRTIEPESKLHLEEKSTFLSQTEDIPMFQHEKVYEESGKRQTYGKRKHADRDFLTDVNKRCRRANLGNTKESPLKSDPCKSNTGAELEEMDFSDDEDMLMDTSKVHIPMEVLEWDYEARRRYVDCLKKGTQMVHRARAMIVGCAGAGKTTLLERLQHPDIDKLKEIESTVGLEVHENIFEIENNSLKALSEDLNNENKCLLSVVDFAGQCAYYACHQVYLSRRAFYLLVIDRSKPFQYQVDRKLCEQEGTMFSDWTYGQYIIFWLKSIHTYCDDDTPVITIGTHCDKIQNVGESIYDDLFELLKDEPELMMHIDSSKCFNIGFPLIDNGPIDKLTDIEECIASIALEDRWKETIPKDWALCEAAFRENKLRGKKMISLSNFKKQMSSKMSKKDKETFDMLRFYHDIGSILHFNEDDLKDKTIVDVQWFVDCFKNIITDTNHVRNIAKNYAQWQDYNKSGYLSEELLHEIWKETKLDLRKCKPTLKYMQRLGLVAVGKTFHYIPCMNKLDFGDDLKKYISSLSQKSSVLIFKFEFLPHFFYFRLVVACMVDAHWTVVEDAGQKYVFKSAVCFTFQEHFIVLAVTMTTIQIQIFRQGDVLSFEVTKKIRDTIIENLKRLTKNFHKKALYLKGYQCSRQSVLEELTSDFLLEDEILGKGQITCPRHGGKSHHFVSERELLLYWTDEKQEDITEAKVIQGMQEHRKDDFSASIFRKPNDNSLHSMELKTFFSKDWQDSVGHLLCCDLAGTAFRVGDRYLLTAFHIIERILDACLKMIIENVQCDPNRGNNCLYLLQGLEVEMTGSGDEKMIENGIKEWITKCKDNFWISSLLEVLRVTGFSFARENILKNISENHMQVVFGRMKEHEEGTKYPVKFDIPFYSKTEDIAILEVVPTNIHRLPTAFVLERSPIAPESIHIVGYPASHGRKQIFDPKCPLISEMAARSTLEQWKVMFPGENFENFSRACASAFSGREKVLFHCSESTAHGASGSPGLILSDTDKPKVYLMLQEGFPSFVYGNNCQVDIKTVPKEYLIESGISMSRVYSLLSTTPYLVNLRNAIFHI